MKKLTHLLKKALTGVRQLGPYAAIELLIPGGTVIAVLLWLYRRHKRIEVHS